MVETLYRGWEVLEKPKRGLRDRGCVDSAQSSCVEVKKGDIVRNLLIRETLCL